MNRRYRDHQRDGAKLAIRFTDGTTETFRFATPVYAALMARLMPELTQPQGGGPTAAQLQELHVTFAGRPSGQLVAEALDILARVRNTAQRLTHEVLEIDRDLRRAQSSAHTQPRLHLVPVTPASREAPVTSPNPCFEEEKGEKEEGGETGDKGA